MNDEQNETPNQPSLLDRIHLFREFAKRAGWSDVAEWLTKHADEPCPAAIAQFMEMGAVVEKRCFQCAHFQSTAAEVCPNAVSADGAHKWGHFKLSTDLEPSEASRTDAVKEASFAAKFIEECGNYMPNEGGLYGKIGHAIKILREADVALADAERKLACGHHASLLVRSVESDYEYCQLCETRDRLRDALTMERTYAAQLAAAEQRAKDAEADVEHVARVRDLNCGKFIAVNDRSAVLTRKLAVAREAILRADEFLGLPLNAREWLKKVLAAIDAPAGEEAIATEAPHLHAPDFKEGNCETRDCHLDSGVAEIVYGLWGAGVKTATSCEGGGPEKGHGRLERIVTFGWNDPLAGPQAYKAAKSLGMPAFMLQQCWPDSGCGRGEGSFYWEIMFDRWTPWTRPAGTAPPPEPANTVPANGAHPFGACCPMKAPPFCACPCHSNPVTEPVSNVLLDALTEPANAQGSEAEVCGAFWGRCRNAKPCALHPEPSHPSAPRFTAEEARERSGIPYLPARESESWRHYADLLERHDALERAAEGALKLLHDVFDFTKRTPQVEATIANLSAVLAQHAGKAE